MHAYTNVYNTLMHTFQQHISDTTQRNYAYNKIKPYPSDCNRMQSFFAKNLKTEPPH